MVRAASELGKVVAQEYGVRLRYHPHADSHVGTPEQTERFLDETDPATYRCAWTPGTWLTGTRTTRPSSAGYPDRTGYVHIKQIDPAIVAAADRDGLAFGQAVGMGASCEPPGGEPDIETVTKALLELDADLFVVVEQDMYPVGFELPKPIAQRTFTYLRSYRARGWSEPLDAKIVSHIADDGLSSVFPH